MAKQAFENFVKELPFRLRRVGPAVTDRLEQFARTLETRLKAAAPKRTGAMAQAINVKVNYTPPRGNSRAQTAGSWAGGLVIEINDPAANALEQGGVVRGEPLLAIPLRRELERFAGPRETGRYFVVTMRDGRKFLADDDNGRVRFSYRLKNQVFLAKNPFIMQTIRQVAPGFVDGVLRDGATILSRPLRSGGPFDPSRQR